MLGKTSRPVRWGAYGVEVSSGASGTSDKRRRVTLPTILDFSSKVHSSCDKSGQIADTSCIFRRMHMTRNTGDEVTRQKENVHSHSWRKKTQDDCRAYEPLHSPFNLLVHTSVNAVEQDAKVTAFGRSEIVVRMETTCLGSVVLANSAKAFLTPHDTPVDRIVQFPYSRGVVGLTSEK